MAFLLNDYQQQRKKEDGVPDTFGGSGGAPISAPPAPAPGAPGQATQPGQAAVQAPAGGKQGTGFINPGDYLAANRGAGEAMAGQLAGGVQKAGEAAQKGLTDLLGQYSQQVTAGTVAPWGTTTGPLARAGTPDGRGTPAPAVPGATTYNPMTGGQMTWAVPDAAGYQTAKAADTASKATYSGPNSAAELPGYQAVADNARQASERAQALNSFTGRQAMLQDGAKGPYSQGSSILDSFLSGAAGAPQFQQTQAQYGGLPGSVAKAAGDTSQADAARATSQANAGAAKDWVTGQANARNAQDASNEAIAKQYRDAISQHGIHLKDPSYEEFARRSAADREHWARWGSGRGW